jgi:asparagine synthase (glutamine-hydrolysing)
MCGICGVIWKQRGAIDESAIRRMNNAMTHRGPDDEGYYVDGTTHLAMRRLSIIDRSGGHQPISTPDGRYTIVFNGEIYNYKSIRDELEVLGHVFRTQSDTEVVLLAYAQWRGESVHKLQGMFAYAIWDRENQDLFLARDRLGIKPLFYCHTPQLFAFGSELKVLKQVPGFPREIDHEAIHHMIALGSVPTPMSLFRNVRQIPPGHRAWYRGTDLHVEEYWDIPFDTDPTMSEQDALEGLDGLLRESVRMRLMSEVPLGAFLSGGVDSSLVVAMMAQELSEPVKTFTISWGDENADFNEDVYSTAVAQQYKTEHHVHTIGLDDLIGELPRLIWLYDQPTASAFQSYFVSAFTRRHVTVALSGLGGDEIAAGYPFFHEYHVRERKLAALSKIPTFARQGMSTALSPFSGPLGRVGRVVGESLGTPGQRYSEHRMYTGIEDRIREGYTTNMREHISEKQTENLISRIIDHADSDDIVNKITYHELRRYMVDDPLTDTDRCSMAHSLEVRVPLIDHRLVEFAGTIPAPMKVRNGENKYLLKRLAENYLPHHTIYRPKMGFSIPLVHWVSGGLSPLIDKILSPESVEARGLFKPEAVQRWRASLADSPTRGEAAFVWSIAVLELWCRLYLDMDTPDVENMSTHDLIHRKPVERII